MTNEPIESKLLGKMVDYPQRYCPEILVAVPRQINRDDYGIAAGRLPFVGYDSWHAYELSFLTERGLPVQGVLKLTYSAESEFLVESKSLKLYLNSFNMERYGATADEGRAAVEAVIRRDLSLRLKTDVEVAIFTKVSTNAPNDFDDYAVLEENDWADDLSIADYTETPHLLEASNGGGEMKIATHLLRSNCKITHQPDWGSAFIRIESDTLPTAASVLKYIVSIRNENHFHEEICEMIFKRLLDRFAPSALMVCCIYTRRGGIDICPARASSHALLPKALVDNGVVSAKLMRQ